MKCSHVATMYVVFVLLAQACAVPPAQAAEVKQVDLPALKNTSVNMPWQELKALMARAKPDDGAKAPVDYVLSPAAYSAAVAGPWPRRAKGATSSR